MHLPSISGGSTVCYEPYLLTFIVMWCGVTDLRPYLSENYQDHRSSKGISGAKFHSTDENFAHMRYFRPALKHVTCSTNIC